jgi:hypothetical protein
MGIVMMLFINKFTQFDSNFKLNLNQIEPF